MFKVLSRSTQLVIDFAILSLAIWLAFLIRFEGDLPVEMRNRLLILWPYVVGLEYFALMAVGVPRFSWRYFGLREGTRVFGAIFSAFAVMLVLRFALPIWVARIALLQHAFLPVGVLFANGVLAFLGIAGIRALRRIQAEHSELSLRKGSGKAQVRTILLGAGQAGVLVAKEVLTRPDLGVLPVGFLDDDPAKVGTVVHGLPVLGNTSQLGALSAEHHVEEALITIASAPGATIRRLKALCDEANLPAKIIPGLFEIVGGRVNLSAIRKVSIEDLLGRDAVMLEPEPIAEKLKGRAVLVTGAGGSIGSELCRQVLSFFPARLVLVEQAENALFNIHRELFSNFPGLSERIVPCIGDICDRGRMERIFDEHRPEVVFHAAAHKHVPMMEWNPGEAVRNNVFGTHNLAEVATEFGTGTFVMISTDKAVNPTSVMGATKRAAELSIQSMSARSSTCFVAVRFGNVLGSAGSVIPIFQEQIAKGGPVTVTHPEMKRYFMTIPEACQLVLQAGSMGRGGEVFILDMGQPVKIVNLARDLITLSGLRPDEDIEIVFTGLRPGEKLFEELTTEGEAVDRTRHPKIFIAKLNPPNWAALKNGLEHLRSLVDRSEVNTDAELRLALKSLVPEYAPSVPQPASSRRAS